MPILKNNWRTICGAALALIVGVGAGYALRTATHKVAEPPPLEAEVLPAGQIGKPRILPGTEVSMTYTFLLCGHELTQTEQGGELVGCTLEDVMRKLPQARVSKLGAETAVIEQELACYCPAHYVLYLEENTLRIAHTDETEWGREHVQTILFDTALLPAEMAEELQEGLVFAGMEQINEYLEGADG